MTQPAVPPPTLAQNAVPGVTLFRRACNLVVGLPGGGPGLQIASEEGGLDFEFKVKKTLKPEPNTCEIKIYGLQALTRNALCASTPGGVGLAPLSVALSAGYVGGLSQLYLGQMRSAQFETSGPDVITEITTGDGDKQIRTSRLNIPIGPGTTPTQALNLIVAALGCGPGNLAFAQAALLKGGVTNLYVKGGVLRGNVAQHLTEICRSAGLEWSIQDGNLQVLLLGQPLAGQAVALTPTTGLLGTPSVDTKGLLSCKTLLIPQIKPGVLVAITSQNVNGGFRVKNVTYQGSTFGEPWWTLIEADKF